VKYTFLKIDFAYNVTKF